MGRGNFLPIFAIAFLIIVAVGFILFKPSFQKPVFPTPSPIPSVLNSCDVLTEGSTELNFPSLYKEGITWENSTQTEFEVSIYPSSKIMKGCLIKSKQTGIDKASEVENYYNLKSQEQKWEIKDAGDGPGFGYITWKITDRYFLVTVDEVKGNMNMKTVTLFLSQ